MSRLVERLRRNETARHLCGLAADEVERLEGELARVRGLLVELHAQVRGECPSLLSEDGGANGDFVLRLEAEVRS